MYIYSCGALLSVVYLNAEKNLVINKSGNLGTCFDSQPESAIQPFSKVRKHDTNT